MEIALCNQQNCTVIQENTQAYSSVSSSYVSSSSPQTESFQSKLLQQLQEIPVWLYITVFSYIFLSTIFAIVMYSKLKKYFPVKEVNKQSCCLKAKKNSKSQDTSDGKINPNISAESLFSSKDQSKEAKSNLIVSEEIKAESLNQNRLNLNDTEDYKNRDSNYNTNNDSNDNDLDQQNEEFARNDTHKLSFIRCLFCALFLFWIRLLTMVICLLTLVILSSLLTCCRLNHDSLFKVSKFRRFWSRTLIILTCGPLFLVNGLIACFRKKNDSIVKTTYRKYLGDTYDTDTEKHFSSYISNHYGWVESFYYGLLISPGFIAKKELGKNPILGPVLSILNCVLLDRDNKNERKDTSDVIMKRQKMFYEKETFSPVFIYPEGTITNGRYLLKFKKGAFASLLPIKPLFAEMSYGLAECPMPSILHFFYVFGFIWNIVGFYEMPVVECNEYMLEKWRIDGESDADCYARVVSMIYLEIYGLKLSERGYKDLDKYEKICENRD